MTEGESEPVWQSVWSRSRPRTTDASYGRLILALRRFLAAFAGAGIDGTLAADLTETLDRHTVRLCAAAVDERDQPYAQCPDFDGRGQVTAPAIRYEALGASDLTGTVTFDRYFLGSNGAAHGGAIAFMFDEAAGRLSHLGGRATARTAYLNTTFRSIAPIGIELVVSGHIVREEGRKRFLHLVLVNDGTVCAEAEALMVELRPGQS